MLKVDGVFAGGGMKAFSFVGALKVLEEKGIVFERLAGTSAGAIVASFIQAGYKSAEIEDILDHLDLKTIVDPKYEERTFIFQFYKWLKLYRKMGLHKGDYLESWLRDILAKKGVHAFGDLPPDSLKMIGADITNSRLIVIPDDLPKYGLVPETFPVSKAIQISCSFPFFFEPVRLSSRQKNSPLFIDGGIVSNFPIWLFNGEVETKQLRPVLGFRLSEAKALLPPKEINNAFSLLQSTVETMWMGNDQRYISKSIAKNIVFIPADNVSTLQFSISSEEKEKLIRLGEERTKEFLQTWSY